MPWWGTEVLLNFCWETGFWPQDFPATSKQLHSERLELHGIMKPTLGGFFLLLWNQLGQILNIHQPKLWLNWHLDCTQQRKGWFSVGTRLLACVLSPALPSPSFLLPSSCFRLKSLKNSGPGAALYEKNLPKKIDLNGKSYGDRELMKEKS